MFSDVTFTFTAIKKSIFIIQYVQTIYHLFLSYKFLKVYVNLESIPNVIN